MIIVSRNNPLVRELASLKEKKFRRECGRFLVEGEKMVRECAESPLKINRLIVREDYAGEQFPFPGVTLGNDAFAAVCDEKTPQGICAEVEIPHVLPCPPQGRCLMLDGVSDPANVGAIIRTACAAGYRQIYLADCADPFSPKSVRASMSGVFFTRLMMVTREEALSLLEGVPLIAADMDGESVFSFSPPEVFALCIGNEGNGLSAPVRSAADFTVKIPMEEHTESLNAAVSAGIMMYLLNKNHFE